MSTDFEEMFIFIMYCAAEMSTRVSMLNQLAPSPPQKAMV